MTPRNFAIGFIRKWEDGGSTDPNRTHSLDPDDSGNWTSGRVGVGALVGSNHGVTAPALAVARNVPVTAITPDVMHALTINEAADIALNLYYKRPGIDRLAWNRVTASVMDMAWGAGAGQAIRLLQRMIGAQDDGSIGPGTVQAYAAYIARHGEEDAAVAYAAGRNAFYDQIIASQPRKGKYGGGWKRRSNGYTKDGDPAWWNGWDAVRNEA